MKRPKTLLFLIVAAVLSSLLFWRPVSSHRASAAKAAAGAYTLVVEPDQGMTAIYSLIDSAKKSIDITMYELTDRTMLSLLTTAAANDITVRVILDRNNEEWSNTAAYDYLRAHNIAVHWANPKYVYTHQKTITVDGVTSAILTLNLTPRYYSTTRDYAVITSDPADVAAIETTFAADFNDRAITPPDGDNLVWSPTNSRRAITGLIDGAAKSIEMEEEELSDRGVLSALEDALARGVAVTLVQENVDGKYDAALAALRNDGARIAFYTSPHGYYIHAKVILVDDGVARARMFIGSENITATSLNENRELGLIFSDAADMKTMHAAIDADYRSGTRF